MGDSAVTIMLTSGVSIGELPMGGLHSAYYCNCSTPEHIRCPTEDEQWPVNSTVCHIRYNHFMEVTSRQSYINISLPDLHDTVGQNSWFVIIIMSCSNYLERLPTSSTRPMLMRGPSAWPNLCSTGFKLTQSELVLDGPMAELVQLCQIRDR